ATSPAAEVYQKVTLYEFMPKFAIKPVNIEARKYSQLRCSYLEGFHYILDPGSKHAGVTET
ncbi:MAG: hypothetical protein LC633_04615, partial [Desulfobulbaceae bacterium]|nr:hypothetical protein [Desulfobulbaceae bacterium]